MKSLEFFKNILHPNANYHSIDESLYKILNDNPEYLHRLIEDLIVKWRRTNPLAKDI